ncbi:MAG TPA: MarR family winged helix-turn-helix transcriptional regulator [Chloroflexota bacterium]|nr:MarR family winged helix-turn-helix transcriptional regulator [Chloroflexota bacterium]
MGTAHQPIGYWLKHLDHLIEASFDRTLADFGIGRRHWQTLNVLATGPHSDADLAEALAPFWVDGGLPPRSQVLTDLEHRDWVDVREDGYALTNAGRLAHSELADRVRIARQRATDGISAAEYASAVRTLERMAANLAAEAAA